MTPKHTTIIAILIIHALVFVVKAKEWRGIFPLVQRELMLSGFWVMLLRKTANNLPN